MSESNECLKVTNVEVYPFKPGANKGHQLGVAKIVLNDQLQIRNLRIMDGENGKYVGYPIDKSADDWFSIALPITRQLREHIEQVVLEKYQDEIDKSSK